MQRWIGSRALGLLVAFNVVAQDGGAQTNTHSVDLDGVDDGFETTADFTDYGPNSVTVESWLKTSVDNASAYAVAVNTGTEAAFQLYKDGGANAYGFAVELGDSSAAQVFVSETQVEDGAWHHLAGVYDGSQVRLYLDGVLKSTAALSGAPINTPGTTLTIGFAPSSGGPPASFFDGRIDDVRVWYDVRSADEIQNFRSCQLDGRERYLTFYARFNASDVDETGNYALDSLGAPAFVTDVPFSTSCPEPVPTIEFWGGSLLGLSILAGAGWVLRRATGNRSPA